MSRSVTSPRLVETSVATPGFTRTPAVMTALSERFKTVHNIAVVRTSEKVQQFLIGKSPLTIDMRNIDRARAWDERIPSRDVLSTQRDLLVNAVYDRATEAEVRLICATLLDSIPNARNAASAGFIENLVFAISHVDDDHHNDWSPGSGFSFAVLYTAARRIMSVCLFCPSIGEVIEASRKARCEFWIALRNTNKLLDLRLSAEDVIELVDPPELNDCDPDPDSVPPRL